jgi:hypothetical protein
MIVGPGKSLNLVLGNCLDACPGTLDSARILHEACKYLQETNREPAGMT